MIRLMLVDDHAIVRSGLHMILDPEEDIQIIGEGPPTKARDETGHGPKVIP